MPCLQAYGVSGKRMLQQEKVPRLPGGGEVKPGQDVRLETEPVQVKAWQLHRMFLPRLLSEPVYARKAYLGAATIAVNRMICGMDSVRFM